jgi:hypothetical protein
MEKHFAENTEIPNEIKTNEKYKEHIFNKNPQMCDILNYINNNVPSGDIVLLCNGNYQIGDSDEWNNIVLSPNEALCLSSKYKYIGDENTQNNENCLFASKNFSMCDDFAEETRVTFYNALHHHAFLFTVPLSDELVFDEFYFFNEKNVNKLINHLFVHAMNYNMRNISCLNSVVLFNDKKNNYQDIEKYNLSLTNELNIEFNVSNYLVFAE